MSSPCNMPRLVGCRVRDFASCFYACRLQALEEETDTSPTKPSHQVSSDRARVFGSKAAGGAHKTRKKMSGGNGERSSVQKLSRSVSRVAEDGNGSEPRFADEDYIVFCFREDGKIDMINDGNYKKSSSGAACRDEIGDGHEHIISATTLRPLIIGNEDDEKGSKEKGTDCPPNNNDEIKEITSTEQSNRPTQMDPSESCDSNLSDSSTSSFAFPALGINWIGSPVHMPKSEKPEARCLRPNCCRF